MKQQWQPCYPGNPNDDESNATLADKHAAFGCGHEFYLRNRDGWWGDVLGHGVGSGRNGGRFGGGWGNGHYGWHDGSGNNEKTMYSGLLIGPAMLDMCVAVKEFEGTV